MTVVPMRFLASVAAFSVLAAALAACQTQEELLPSNTPTLQPSPSPSAQPTASAQPAASPAVEIPADWQTYVDPKGRLSIRVPPDWEAIASASQDYKAWLQVNVPSDGELTDGVKLEVVVAPRESRTLDDLAAIPPQQGFYPRVSLQYVTTSGRRAIHLTRGLDAKMPKQVSYVLERGDDFVSVNLYVGGSRTFDYISTFEDLVIKSLLIT